MKVVAIVQARMNSTRLPNKVMKLIGGTPMIGILLGRLANSSGLDEIIVATSLDKKDESLVNYVRQLGFVCFQGSENDVLQRYIDAGKAAKADVIVRITGDCPLIDSNLVDQAILCFKQSNVDYVSNINPPTFPDGLDIEVIDFAALIKAGLEATNQYDREHVTPYITDSGIFSQKNLSWVEDLSKLRWTVDEQCDFEVVKTIFEEFAPRFDFGWEEILALHNKQPELFSLNQDLGRNEGAFTGTGQKLWNRAKRIIPGGNMLLSKRSEMFLPNQWPSYFSKAKGCMVWDLDGRKYTDMSIMGVGTNILGYGHPEVDAAVHKTIDAGNMSTLNCPEEVFLAEKLIELHPWADMVRLARTGGEANAIAIRIARAASGRDKVAVCGYHGWHDWYLSANLGDDENLAGHLLPGLDPKGVPKNLKETVFPFKYNDYEGLEKLVTKYDIGVIKMEVVRNTGPENNFLQKIRRLATDRGIVLIFDECTSGFRQNFGGIHKIYGVEPDIAMFGKALGNGYAITAIIGRKEVMEEAQSTFISSTFWTERIGPTAAIKTLDVMESLKSWEVINDIGLFIRQEWENIANKHELDIDIWGLPALSGFTFSGNNSLAYKTYITQEMMSKGFLAGNCVYACIEHTQETVRDYLNAIDPIFKVIKECEEGRDIDKLIKGPLCHSGFKRLN